MLARVSIQQWQGLALCRHGRIHNARKVQAPAENSILWQGGGSRIHKERFLLQHLRSSRWCAEYTDSKDPNEGFSEDFRDKGLNLATVYGERVASSSTHVHSSEADVAQIESDGEVVCGSFVGDENFAPLSEGHVNGHSKNLYSEGKVTELEEGAGESVAFGGLSLPSTVPLEVRNGYSGDVYNGDEGTLSSETHNVRTAGHKDESSGASEFNGNTAEEINHNNFHTSEWSLKTVERGSKKDSLALRDNFQEADITPSTDEVNFVPVHPDSGLTELECYIPQRGHRVLGVVVSGNHVKLDVDIGAAELGHLHVQDLLPFDRFGIEENKWNLTEDVDAEVERENLVLPPNGRPWMAYDEEVFTDDDPAPLVVDVGTVLDLEVVGETLAGKPLLSVRRASQRVAWDRVLQIQEENEPIEIEITDWNKTGLVARVEGLRAFLPLAEFVKQPDKLLRDKHKEFVGTKLWVSIVFAREIRGNIILSERDAWVKRNLQPGTLHGGTIVQILPYGALVQVDGTDIWGIIHISNIADARIHKVSDVFEVGEHIKMISVECPDPKKLSFSTALLESEHGLMLRDKERVFKEAEQTARRYKGAKKVYKQAQKDDAEKPTYWKPPKPIANLDWLDFGDTVASVL